MTRFSHNQSCVQAVRDGLIEMHRIHAQWGQFDGHDLINWLNQNRNAEFNDLIDCYRATPGDYVHVATIQVGNYLKNHLGQVKIGERVSQRYITLRNGTTRDGVCEVSIWRIDPTTTQAATQTKRELGWDVIQAALESLLPKNRHGVS